MNMLSNLSPMSYPKLTLSALVLGVTLLVSSCGGGTTNAQIDADLSSAQATGLRPLPAVFTTGKSVAYSPYRTAANVDARANEVITDEQVKQDLDLLVTAGIGLIRIFDSSDKVAARTLRVIKANDLNIKVMLGIYVNSFETQADATVRARVVAGNEDEIARGVRLAKAYPNEVVAVSVGNETLVEWSFGPISTATMAKYLKTVRDQITQPITTDDNWAFFAGYGRNAADQATEVLRQIDFASLHTYPGEDLKFSDPSDADARPDWDWKQLGITDLTKRASAMMSAAVSKAKKDYAAARAHMDKSGYAHIPIVIGETGWKAADPSKGENGVYKFFAHPANQKMYYTRLLDWAVASRTNDGPKGLVYFEAFDEPWKGSDDKWGLFNVNREARCTAQALNSKATWAKDNSASCAESAALYFTTPKLNPAVTDSKLVIHSETVTGWPTGMRSDAYANDTFTLAYPLTGDSAPSDLASTVDASHYISLSNFNNSAGYGWGLLWQSSSDPKVTANMSNFASGSVRFSIKTAYVGSLLISLSSDTESGRTAEAVVLVSDGKYGYCNTGSTWCDVTIPLSAFQAASPDLDLRYILTRFAISDVWDKTKNTARQGMPEIRLDNIHWAK